MAVTLRNVAEYVSVRKDFDCNGTLSGRAGGFPSSGHLPLQYLKDFSDTIDAHDFYVVMSYATPIAWFAMGVWHVPNVRYSVTTARHLGSLGLELDRGAVRPGDKWIPLQFLPSMVGRM